MANDKYGCDKVKALGTVDMGIPSYDKEPYMATQSLSNKWTAMQDTSAAQAKKIVGASSKKDKYNK